MPPSPSTPNLTPHPKLQKKTQNLLNIVLELPPAPADLVLLGLAFATLSARSAAALRRIAVLGPPGGEEGRAVLRPLAWGGEFTGELGRGEDCEDGS